LITQTNIPYYRSWDGLTLYAASSDGTIAAFQFDKTELEGIATHTDQEQYLAKFGFVPPPLPEGYTHVSKQTTGSAQVPVQQTNGFGAANNGPEKVNILVAKKKKRVGLTPAAAVPSARSTVATATPAVSTGPKRVPLTQVHDAKLQSSITPSTSFSSSFPAPSEQPFVDPTESWSRHGDLPMELDTPIDGKGKRKASSIADLLGDDGPRIKPRTLGGDRPVELHVPKEISSWASAPASVPLGAGGASSSMFERTEVFTQLPLLTYLSCEVEEGLKLEAKNAEDTSNPTSCFIPASEC